MLNPLSLILLDITRQHKSLLSLQSHVLDCEPLSLTPPEANVAATPFACFSKLLRRVNKEGKIQVNERDKILRDIIFCLIVKFPIMT